MTFPFQIRVRGKNYGSWESAKVSRTIDNLCGEFVFESSIKTDFPIDEGDRVDIITGGQVKLTGYVDTITASGNESTGDKIRVEGRDITEDIVDSSVPPSAKNLKSGTLKEMVEKIIYALGIINIKVLERVTPKIEPFKEFAFGQLAESASAAQYCFDFLRDFARKRQVYLITSSDGNVIIFRPDLTKSPVGTLTRLKNGGKKNNVKSYSWFKSTRGQYGFINVTGQADLLATAFTEEAAGINKGISVPGIRPSRYLEILTEESMQSIDIDKRAQEEINIRKTKARWYKGITNGFTAATGDQYEIGQKIEINDEFARMKGVFLISSYDTIVDLRQGIRTILTCVEPDGYQAVASSPNFLKNQFSMFEENT